jgi:Putative auto-transporter adhesin, head GIN domain
MKTLSVMFAALLFLTFSIQAVQAGEMVQGSGRMTQETRTIQGIARVDLATIGTLYLTLGDKEELRIEAEDNLLPYLLTAAEGDELVIKTKDNVELKPTQPVRFHLTVKKLNALAASSAGNIEAGAIKAERFLLVVSSAGNVTLESLDAPEVAAMLNSAGNATIKDLQAKDLRVNINSSGGLTIEKGEVEKQAVTQTSAGNYNARGLKSRKAQALVNSAGSATLWVTDALTATVNSIGSLSYRGSPTVEEHATSLGTIRKIDN